MDLAIVPLVLGGTDYVHGRIRDRLAGLGDDEYLWEPVADCWTVRRVDDRWLVDRPDPAPEPAPVTTIAWRLWHLASDCLASYVTPHLGEWPLEVPQGLEWYGSAADALTTFDVAYEAFRSRLAALGEKGIAQELGSAWGPYARDSWAALVVHAMDELAHHGAEIAVLRDLYLRR